MIKYTKEQMNSLRQVIFNDITYESFVLQVFLKDYVYSSFVQKKTSTYIDINYKELITFSSNECKACNDPKIIYKRMVKFSHIKIDGKNPNLTFCDIIKKLKNIIFEVEKNDLPLYINDPLTEPITLWRLRNNI